MIVIFDSYKYIEMFTKPFNVIFEKHFWLLNSINMKSLRWLWVPGTLGSNIETRGNPVFPLDIRTVTTAPMIIWSCFKNKSCLGGSEEAQCVVCTRRMAWSRVKWSGADNASEGNLGVVEMFAKGRDGAARKPLGRIERFLHSSTGIQGILYLWIDRRLPISLFKQHRTYKLLALLYFNS